MRAFVVTAPHEGAVQEVPNPIAGPGQVVVDISRAGVCGTDVEFWTGEMAYLHQGHARYPLRPGHEWCGVVSALGAGVDATWLGRRVTGDTMLGCGHCDRCSSGHHNVCEERVEIGIRRWLPRRPGRAAGGAGNRVAGVAGQRGRCRRRDGRAWRQRAPFGPGGRTLGRRPCAGARHRDDGASRRRVRPRRGRGRSSHGPIAGWPQLRPGPWFRRSSGGAPIYRGCAGTRSSTPPTQPNSRHSRSIWWSPGKRVVYLGLSGTPSLVDTRTIALKDVTAVGILAASQGLAGTIEHYAAGTVDPRPLVAATVGLHRVGDVLAGWRPRTGSGGPKLHIDPRLQDDTTWRVHAHE